MCISEQSAQRNPSGLWPLFDDNHIFLSLHCVTLKESPADDMARINARTNIA